MRVRALIAPACGALLCCAACTALSNPDRDDLVPVAGPVVGSQPAAKEPKTPPAAAPAEQTPVGASSQDPAAAQPPGPPVPENGPRPRNNLGSIAGRPLLAEDLVARLWTNDTRRVRDALEQIVFAELALQEADRLRVSIDPKLADAAYAKAREAVAKKHAEGQSKLTLEEYIERVLEIRPERYFEELRRETVVQLLAARCVRAWTLENDLAEVRLTEVRDPAALEATKADLAAGKSLEEVAKAHGHGEDEATHITPMRLVRSESHELARVVFATPVGTIGGPIEQAGRSVYFVVDRIRTGREGLWREFAEEVERELALRPVDNLEFVQWHAAMRRRYRVELAPFFDFVDPRR